MEPAPLTVTADSASRVYGAPNPAFTANYGGFVNGDAASVISGQAVFNTGAGNSSPVGTYPIAPSAGTLSAANYSFANFVDGTLTVTPAPLTVTASALSKPYGQTLNFAPGSTLFSASGLQNGEVIGSVTLACDGGAAAAAVGAYPITPSAATGGTFNAANYSISYAAGTLTVVPATPAVTWANPAPIIYGTALGASQLNASGSVPGRFTFSPATGTVLAAGTNTLSVLFRPTDTTDYTNATTSVNLVVTPASLTIAANDTNRLYGAANPVFSATYSGFVNGDTAAVIGGQAAFNTTAAKTSPVGTYAIIPSVGTLSANNYKFSSFLNGVFTVTPAPLTVTASDEKKTVGQTLDFGSGSTQFLAAGLQNGETIGSVTLACDGGAATSAAGTYPITPSAATGGTFNAANYSITYVPGTLTVVQPTPVITWTNLNLIVYGTPLSTNQLNASASVEGNFSYSPANGTVLPAGTNILSVAFTPTDTAEYNSVTDRVSLVVMPAPLAVTANNANRLYGAANPVFTATYGGFVNGDTAAVVAGQAAFSTTASASSAIGIYPIVPSVGSLSASNYTFATFVSGLITVAPAPLTVAASSASRSYGAANPAFTASISGFVNGDTLSVVGGHPALTTSATGASAVGTYSIVPSAGTLSAQNYSFTNFVNGVLTVDPALLTITANSGTKTYGEAEPASGFGFTPTGLLNSDIVGNVTLTSGGFAASASVSGSPYPIVPSAAAGTGLGNYTITYVNGIVTVRPATPVITWLVPAPIVSGTALGTNQLDATANVPGSFDYNPASGTVLPAGTNMLSVAFTPSDSIDYSSATNRVSLVVLSPPPESISITFPTTNATYTTTSDNVNLGGTVSDVVDVLELTWSNSRGGGGLISGPFAAGTNDWSVPAIPLDAGSNVVTVTAFDTAANSASATITILYTQPTGPVFTNVRLSGANLSANLTGLSNGATVILETSNDLETWTPAQTNVVSGTSLPISVPINKAPGGTFLRVVVQ